MNYTAVLQRYDDAVCDVAHSDDRAECWNAALTFYGAMVRQRMIVATRGNIHNAIDAIRDDELVVAMYEHIASNGPKINPTLVAWIGATLEDGQIASPPRSRAASD